MNPNKPELPLIGSVYSDVITTAQRWTEVFTVGATAVELKPTNGGQFTRIGIQNPTYDDTGVTSLIDAFIGGSTVTSTGATRGRMLKPGEDRDEDTTLAPYAICKTAQTVKLTVEFSK